VQSARNHLITEIKPSNKHDISEWFDKQLNYDSYFYNVITETSAMSMFWLLFDWKHI